jgi:hypothetical protein
MAKKVAGSRGFHRRFLIQPKLRAMKTGNSLFTILNSPFCAPFRDKSIEVPLHEPFTRQTERFQSSPVKPGQDKLSQIKPLFLPIQCYAIARRAQDNYAICGDHACL